MADMIREKLTSRKGESLAEVLISVLIIAVGLVVLSTMVMASSRMVDKGQTKMATQYNGENAMESQRAGKATVSTGKTISIKEGSALVSDITVSVYSDADSKLMSYAVE